MIGLGIFMVASALPPILIVLAGIARGRSTTVHGGIILLSAVFGAGLSLINHATGYIQ